MKLVMENWRNFLSEITQASESETEEDIAVQGTEESQENSQKGEINPRCRCVDRSETSLTVKQIQKALNSYIDSEKLDIPKLTSGTCDKDTQNLILKFQTDTNIQQDGCVGDETEGKMFELSIITQSDVSRRYNPKTLKPEEYQSTDKVPDIDVSTIGTASGLSSGVTISIIASRPGPFPPARGMKANYQGHGYSKTTLDDSSIINAVDFRPKISGAVGIDVSPGRGDRQYGNPVLRDLLIKAAAEVYDKTKDLYGPDVNLGNAQLWNVSSKHGGKLRKHMGHQSGLECDVSFYKKIKNGKVNKYTIKGVNPKTGKLLGDFDMLRNCIFMSVILTSAATEAVLVEPALAKEMSNFAKANNIKWDSSKLYGAKPDAALKGNGHNDHYHIRCEFPANSMTMADYKKVHNSYSPSTSGPVRFRKLTELSLEEIKRSYPSKTQFSYTFGTVDGKVIESYNSDTLFYGASMPKTMAGLVQLVTYKDTPDKQLNKYELEGLLTYWSRRAKYDPKYKKWKGSNLVQRGISSTYSGSVKHRRKNLGIITPQDVRKVSRYFGISDKSGFLFGGGRNRQTTMDAFLFFAGLSRMDQEKFNQNDQQPGGLFEFYNENKDQVKNLIRAQKLRVYSSRMKPSGALDRNHWGKGGLYNGSVNFVFIIDNKYIISVYTQARPRVYFPKDAPKDDPRRAQRQSNNFHGYDLLNAVIYKLLQRT